MSGRYHHDPLPITGHEARALLRRIAACPRAPAYADVGSIVLVLDAQTYGDLLRAVCPQESADTDAARRETT